MYIDLVTARKRSLRRLCFYTCLSVNGGGELVSQHALQVVSQHALQVSRGMCIPACLAGFQAHTQVELEGSGQGGLQAHTWRGGSGPHPGESPGPHPGGLQAHIWGEVQAHTRGVSRLTPWVRLSRSTPGGGNPSMH